jgi:hypothetical protein
VDRDEGGSVEKTDDLPSKPAFVALSPQPSPQPPPLASPLEPLTNSTNSTNTAPYQFLGLSSRSLTINPQPCPSVLENLPVPRKVLKLLGIKAKL